ncbi:MAG: M1 family metallopeptidase [Flammeovirgaceae bacterium]|nr:M1 family metallopeptidase [Flammeovirgaceae bacterium]
MIRILLLLLCPLFVFSQDYRWQQRVEYTMAVNLNVKTHKVMGTQKLIYFNNSPDTLRKVYYHLYFNAFQPGSMMDVRSRTIADPDRRVMDRISRLAEDEIGYQKITSLKQDGKSVASTVNGTILEVVLAKPILPKTKTQFDLEFESQVPIQIRRSGRDSKEGISYSMTQWYPKLAEYDYQGWHAYQYVAREFHGVWGDFDVKITIDPAFVIGGTGVLQNPEAIGHGYGEATKRPTGDLTWHFKAKDVIDFAFAADPDYVHDKIKVPEGPEVHFFYQATANADGKWKTMQDYALRHFQFMNKTFGKYPHPVYSVIQGGDGGMEYPMCTLITGERGTLESLVGVMAHEVSHSWYQMTLASNESLYAWMDEGYTDFSSSESEAFLYNRTSDPHKSSYDRYFNLIERGLQEPMSQHSDHFNTNTAYGTSAYSMGAVFLNQLKYIIGNDAFYAGMKRYYNTWKMRHPEPNDFIRVMEKQSGMSLQWYLRYWIYTTKRIDYSILDVRAETGGASITLKRIGDFPMPVDLLITYKDGSKEMIYIPMNETLGNKKVEDSSIPTKVLPTWYWVDPTYSITLKQHSDNIESVEIDPSQRMADINRKNNKVNPADLPKIKE